MTLSGLLVKLANLVMEIDEVLLAIMASGLSILSRAPSTDCLTLIFSTIAWIDMALPRLRSQHLWSENCWSIQCSWFFGWTIWFTTLLCAFCRFPWPAIHWRSFATSWGRLGWSRRSARVAWPLCWPLSRCLCPFGLPQSHRTISPLKIGKRIWRSLISDDVTDRSMFIFQTWSFWTKVGYYSPLSLRFFGDVIGKYRKVKRMLDHERPSDFNLKGASFGELALSAGRLWKDILAVVASYHSLRMAEDDGSLVAASTFYIHEVGVGGGYEPFQLVALPFGLKGWVQKISVHLLMSINIKIFYKLSSYSAYILLVWPFLCQKCTGNA